MPTDDQLRQLASWLQPRLGVPDLVLSDAGRPRSGFSAQTSIVKASWIGEAGSVHSERLVLREETGDRAVYPVQDPGCSVEIEVQVRVLSALAGTDVPVAGVVGFESDPTLLGAPFFVMRFVAGDVPIESPMYTTEGFYAEATADQRARLIDDGLAVLARVHAVDWRSTGLGWLSSGDSRDGTGRQLALWRDYLTTELTGRVHPLADRALRWLPDHLPADRTVGFCWGDARPGNIIWQDFRCASVTDFEAACLAGPEFDLGWWLMCDRWAHEISGSARLPGEPTRQQQRDRYAQLSGRDIGDTSAHEVFAALRYAAVVVGVMNRATARGLMPQESTVWRDNPASECLAALLEEVGE